MFILHCVLPFCQCRDFGQNCPFQKSKYSVYIALLVKKNLRTNGRTGEHVQCIVPERVNTGRKQFELLFLI